MESTVLMQTPQPHNADIEAALVVSLLEHPESISEFVALIEPDDFWVADWREAYRAIIELQPSPDPLTVLDHAANARKYTEPQRVEFKKRFGEILESIPMRTPLVSYATTIRDYSVKRRLIRLSQELTRKTAQGEALNGETEEIRHLMARLQSGAQNVDWKIQAKAKLTNARELEEMVDKPIPYLIHPVCVSGALTQIQGAPKGGKSSFTLYLSNCCANEIWPHPDHVSASKPLKILYLAWEDPAIMMSKRLSLYNVGLGLDRKKFSQNIDFVFAPHIFVDQENGAANLLGAIRESKADIVVIDTLSHIHSAESENDAVEMRIPMIRLYEIAQETGVGMIYTHHTAKGSSEKEMHEKARGSVAIAAAWHICLDWGRREEGSDINPVRIQSKFEHEELKWEIAYLKMRDDATGAINGIKWDIQAKTKAQAAKEKESIKDRKKRVIFETMCTLTITKEYTTARETADSCGLGLGEQSVRQTLQAMVEEGKAVFKTGPKGVAMFKPKPILSPASP